jgi:hypothetical protein
VLRHARAEALAILLIWLAATVYCCVVCGRMGYSQPDRTLTAVDIRPILGIPRWFFLGVVVPWLVSGAIGVAFALGVMRDDDLGPDHTAELDADIREEARLDG